MKCILIRVRGLFVYKHYSNVCLRSMRYYSPVLIRGIMSEIYIYILGLLKHNIFLRYKYKRN